MFPARRPESRAGYQGIGGPRSAARTHTFTFDGGLSDRSAPLVSAPVQIPSDATLASLRNALRTHLAGRPTGGELRRALQALCTEAHDRGLRAEELLVRLKQVFYQLPEVQELSHGSDRNDLLNRVVSACIEEYYGQR